jgi:glycosyltransferase involved in cell wall biosynthesis
MDLVLFCHPSFLSSQSMPRFAQMLKTSYEARGHRVELWSPKPRVSKRIPRGRLSKWAGYIDQYILFPIWVRRATKRVSGNTLFVFCDQALGPWVPLINDRPHVVHVHDLLALRSALGDIAENPTSLTGRIYQRYIRRGFQHGRHFISVSNKTRDDLHRFGRIKASISEVVYNGMNFPYKESPRPESLSMLRAAIAPVPVPTAGFILHVGGGQWYKNLVGVVAIYAEYAALVAEPLPLLWVGPRPNAAVKAAIDKVPQNGQLIYLRNLDSATLQALYSLARVLLFPSLAEGFGWPLIEAQACGCPVITTDEPPMNEVAGKAACYLSRLKSVTDIEPWSRAGALVLQKLLDESAPEKAQRKKSGQMWVTRFDTDKAIEEYLAIYEKVLDVARTHGDAELENT